MSTTFDYLDQPSFRNLYCTKSMPTLMKFYVEGIKCSKCVSKIEGLKTVNSELLSLDVDLAHQTATVELKNPEYSFAKVAQSLSHLGFRAVPLQPHDDPSQVWIEASRRDLMRLAVAGFCAGNIMMLAFSVYFGLEGELKRVFEYFQLALYLPVVTYVALPFYQGLWQGIKTKSLSIDGPMAIASFLGFAVSTWNLLNNDNSIYYDSTAGFLFLILATRYLQKRTRYEYLKYLKPQSLSETFRARVLGEKGWIWAPSSDLQKDQIVLVEKGEMVPADGQIVSASAVLDLSVLDGESRPRQVHKGFPVKAGSKLLSSKAEVLVAKTGAQTMLGQLLASLKSSSLEDTDSSRASNRASQWLLAIVLSVAGLVLLRGFFGDFETYFERAFALIVLACPCAMAFGTPLAFSFTMKRAQEKGILIKSARVFENLSRIKTVFFDKTGTLTDRFWKLSQSSLQNPPEIYQHIILSLESSSQHPIAFALREIWSAVPYDEKLTPVVETLPNGVQGKIGGDIWKFVAFVENENKWFGLFKNEGLIWKFQLQSQIRPGVAGVINSLQAADYNVILLSGDNEVETQRVAKILDLPEEYAMANLTPQEKSDIVKNTPESIMIGDGVNDALALKSARVGIAVQGGVDVALRSADVLLLHEDLNSVIELMGLARKARRQIKRNLTLALIYNTTGGMAALLGFVNPFVAALLMPISSIFILIATWWGTRK